MQGTPTTIPTVRDATLADAEVVAALLGDLGYPTAAERVCDRLGRLLATGVDPVLLAEADGEALGLLGLQVAEVIHREGRIARITALVVRDGQRSRGVGRLLVDAATERARALGCLDLELSTNRQRLDAHAFYERLGFETSSIMYHRQI